MYSSHQRLVAIDRDVLPRDPEKIFVGLNPIFDEQLADHIMRARRVVVNQRVFDQVVPVC
jgi:hypothetical protein